MENATVLLKTTDLILKFIDSPILKEILSTKDYEKETKMLAETIKFIGDLLCDAQGMKLQEKGGVINAYNRLRNAFLDAEDFLDQVETRKRMLESDDSDLNEICRFLSCSTPMEVHSAIKEIRWNLESICPDLHSFGLRENISMESTGMRTRVAGSFVKATSIIGRDSDKRKIIDLLLGASIDQGQIPVISILGIGGMGKTTVARLVYGDESRLESCGFDLKMWVSDSQKFGLKLLLQKILRSIIPDDTSLHNLGLDQLQNRVSREICGKKYLLVLDDVENESRRCWTQLEDLLKQGARGSRILVTTRSTRVADVMGSDSATNYELKCLSEKDSWLLFEETAFNFKGSEDEELVEIGKCIVQKCGRVPLAIKTIARLLEGQDKSKWEWVRDNAVDECSDITPILRVSYDVLDAKLKECFQYCALFPKDWPISKEMLVNIWMSNVSVTTNRGQHAEDVFEEVIKTLCSRGFLEEMEKWNDDDGDTYLRMHDLMRDLAKQVAGAEMFVVDSDVVVDSGTLTLDENIRHLNLKSTLQTVERISAFEAKGRRLRTLLHHDIFTWRNPWEKLLSVDKLTSDFQVLRMLDLQKSRFHSLPDSVGRLIHLRYLNLSYNEFNALPDSIAELWNLQSLLLKECYNLKELPVGIRKLINLRHLNLEGCSALTHMPCGMGALKSLRTLNMFIVGHLESEHTAKLEDLEPLSELQGDLAIKLPEEKEATGGAAFLLSNKRLTTLKIEWSDSRHSLASEVLGNDEQMMAKLQPHSDLEKFTLDGYEGLRFPPWADDLASLLPNLVAITIDNSGRCQHLPSFSKLQCLKQLTVCNLLSLEYMEENVPSAVFFPSLEYLWLMGLPEVKGWCRELAARVNQQSSLLPSFPHLSDIHIYGCPHLKMTSLPVSPISVYSLKGDEDDIFTVRAEEALSSRWSRFLLEENDSVASSSSSVSFSGKFHTNDSDLYISTPWEQYLHGNPMSLLIKDSNVFEISSMGMVEALRRMSKCLTNLEMKNIPRLKSIPRVLQYLVALKELSIVSCNDFTCEDEWTGVDMICQPWKGFESLRSVTLYDLPILVRLPKEVQSVTSLQVLEIFSCNNLKELSTDIRDLINLRYLKLKLCADLTETSIFTGLSLSQFQWLRCLCLAHMQRLEYIQENNSAMLSFPSLEHILLIHLPNLRDWCRGQATSQSLLLSCPRLSHVGIHGCGNFNGKSMLLSSVTVFVYGMRLWIPLGLISSRSLSCELYSEEAFLLKAAILEQYHRGNPLSVVINGADVAATLMKLDLAGVSSRLTCLRFKGCRSMKTLPKVLKHLTALQKLSIERCGELTCEEDEQSEDETPWGGFNSLTHLEFSELPKMARLPEWIQFITALQELLICGCNKLLLPDWVHTNFHYVTLPEQQGIRLVRKRYLNSYG